MSSSNGVLAGIFDEFATSSKRRSHHTWSPLPPQKIDSLGLFHILHAMNSSDYMSIRETAHYMGWQGRGTGTSPHPRTVSSWCASRALRAIQVTVPRGTYKVRRADADDFMRRHLREPDRRAP